MNGRAQSFGIALVCALVVLLGRPAAAASLLELNFYLTGPKYSGQIPACDVGLGTIQGRFAEKEQTFWASALTILGFARVRETAYRPWAPNTIPRRFCSAMAMVSDGKARPVYYWIGEDTGNAGAMWDVEWCVDGLDRNLAYSPHCRAARP